MSFKEDLGEALRKAVIYYNDGSSPSDAVVKSAMDMGFNLDQTNRLVEKFNTARTIHHFETHPDDRTGTFELAMKDKVAEALKNGGVGEKEAQVKAAEFHGYGEYLVPEDDMFSDDGAEKTAGAGEPDNPAAGYSLEALGRMAVGRADMSRELAKEAESAAGMMDEAVRSELSKIASEVVSGYDPEERYARFKASCSGLPAFESFDGLVPTSVKKAAAKYERELSRANVVELGDMSKCAGMLEYLGDVSKRASDMHKRAERLRAGRSRAISGMAKVVGYPEKSAAISTPGFARGGGGGPAKPQATSATSGGQGGSGGSGESNGSGQGGKKDKGEEKESKKESEKSRRRRATLDFLGLGSETMPKVREAVTLGVDGKDVIEALKPKTSGPSLKDYINNLRRSDVLNDLYANDPIISEADPHDVMAAYRTIVESSPEVSMNKEVVRAILRQSVNSVAVSPFDVKQWADLENVMLKNRGYSKGGYGSKV